mgnify:CR=1 FL=1
MREFVEAVFAHAGMPLTWKGKGVKEKGFDPNGVVRVAISPVYFRPNEVDYLCGDPTRANKELGWKAKTSFEDLAKLMYEADLATLKKNIK